MEVLVSQQTLPRDLAPARTQTRIGHEQAQMRIKLTDLAQAPTLTKYTVRGLAPTPISLIDQGPALTKPKVTLPEVPP